MPHLCALMLACLAAPTGLVAQTLRCRGTPMRTSWAKTRLHDRWDRALVCCVSMGQLDQSRGMRILALAGLLTVVRLAPLTALQPDTVDPREFSGFTLMVEQDLLYPLKDEDRNYTMGVGLGFSGELGYDVDPVFTPWRMTVVLPLIREGLDRLVPGLYWPCRCLERWVGEFDEHSWIFGATAFTPHELASPDPIFDDRPYASLVFLSTRRVHVDRKEIWTLSSDFTLGVLGLDIAEHVQTWIHRWRGAEPPLGWSNQISEGGELTAMYALKYQRLPLLVNGWFDSDDWFQVQWTWHGLGQLGYYVAAEGGISLRAGRFQSKFWQWASNPLNSQNEAVGRPGEDLEVFVFGALRARGVHHNSLLEGQFRQSVVIAEAKPWILEGEAGVTGSWLVRGRRVGLTWVAVAGRTREFEPASDPRRHWWGSLFATVRFGS